MKRIFHPQGRFLPGILAILGLGTFLAAAQPANDMFANRIPLSGTNIFVTGTSVGATWETGEPVHASYSGGTSVWWSWTAPFSGTVTISTAGSDFDTLLDVYTGSSIDNLTDVASDDDDPDYYTTTSKVVFDVVANETYQISVDGYYGDSGDIDLSLQLGPFVPPPPAPAWTLPDLSGVMVTSSQYAGKVIILNFWATWCNPCKAEMPDLVALQEKYRADGLVIVGADVSWSAESSATVLSFLSSWTPTINYPIVMSTYATEYAYGGINAIPTSFIIDRHNLIRKKFIGTQLGTTFEQQILPLLYDNMRLGCHGNGHQMVVSWPTNAVTFTLESTTNLNSPVWTAWPVAPTEVNGTNTVQVSNPGRPTYFRLHLSN